MELTFSTVRENLCWAPDDPAWGKGISGFTVVDPMLGTDFRFKQGSPTAELGIFPITPEGKGLDRSVWPTDLAERSRTAAEVALRRAKAKGRKVKASKGIDSVIIDFGADG